MKTIVELCLPHHSDRVQRGGAEIRIKTATCRRTAELTHEVSRSDELLLTGGGSRVVIEPRCRYGKPAGSGGMHPVDRPFAMLGGGERGRLRRACGQSARSKT